MDSLRQALERLRSFFRKAPMDHRYHWPDEDVLGRIALVNGLDTRVVGVISDVRESTVEDRSGMEMYLPATQAGPEGAELVVRTQLPPDALASGVMRTLRAYNPEQPRRQIPPDPEYCRSRGLAAAFLCAAGHYLRRSGSGAGRNRGRNYRILRGRQVDRRTSVPNRAYRSGDFCGHDLVLSAVAFMAGYIPARWAWRIDPMIALRGN
jgi:hypothetical protein